MALRAKMLHARNRPSLGVVASAGLRGIAPEVANQRAVGEELVGMPRLGFGPLQVAIWKKDTQTSVAMRFKEIKRNIANFLGVYLIFLRGKGVFFPVRRRPHFDRASQWPKATWVLDSPVLTQAVRNRSGLNLLVPQAITANLGPRTFGVLPTSSLQGSLEVLCPLPRNPLEELPSASSMVNVACTGKSYRDLVNRSLN